MNEESAFLDAIRSKPDDDVTRLVYADWLDEQGGKANADKSAFLRLHCELSKETSRRRTKTRLKQLDEIARVLNPVWLAVVSRPPVENCEPQFKFQCPKRWDRLQPTDQVDVRFCEACRKEVYYCPNLSQARDHAWQGHCVAVQLGLPRTPGDLEPPRMLVGVIRVDPEELSPPEELPTPPIRGSRRRDQRRS